MASFDKEVVMHARTGDRIDVPGRHGGEPPRACVVLEVYGADGAPPYLVRWIDDGHETVFFPGPDAYVHTGNAATG